MKIKQSDLVQIVAQASSVSERLNLPGLYQNSALDEQQEQHQRLEHWCQVIANGNWQQFHKRLQWDGLELEQVRSVLGTVYLTDPQTLPHWAETLKQIIETTASMNRLDTIQAIYAEIQLQIPTDSNTPLAFEEILLPAVLVARQNLLLKLECPSLCSNHLPLTLLSEAAYRTLERSLLEKFVTLCGKTLQFEFNHFRPPQHEVFNLLFPTLPGTSSKEHYHGFIETLLEDGFLSFFKKYAVLARLLATSIDFWVEAIAEFLQRLQADRSKIQQAFAHQLSNHRNQTQLGKVTAIQTSISDLHNCGHSVIALTFESGQKLIYKPKNIGLEATYNQILDWCNQNGAPLNLKVLRILECGTYGWVLDYVKQLPCRDQAAAQRFYNRAGILLCLLYVLGGNDCHFENLIASGEHLVLIDGETLMHHQANPIQGSAQATETTTEAHRQFWESVQRTGLLPRWELSPDGRVAYDISGLGSVDSQPAPWRLSRWKSVNTDDMHLAYEDVKLTAKANVAMLNGLVLSPNDYLEEIIDGFTEMYHFLVQKRELLLQADQLLTTLQNQQVRFIFRATQIYESLLEQTLVPKYLRHGADRSIELDILSQTFLSTEDRPSAWPILAAELKAMAQLDIPYFGSLANSDTLTIGLEQPTQYYFKQPSYNQFITRLQQLDEADLANQVVIIQGSITARIVRKPINDQQLSANAASISAIDESQINVLSSSQLLQQAETIAEDIQKRAVRDPTGGVNWIGLSYIPNAERFQFQPLGYSLYDGSCGIALFLVSLAAINQKEQFLNLGLNALKQIRQQLRTVNTKNAQKFVQRTGIGGAIGIGSIIYSFAKISQLCQDTKLLGEAQIAANLLTPEQIAADQKLDVMGGTAGAILGLLALHAETGKSVVLDKAVTCGQHPG